MPIVYRGNKAKKIFQPPNRLAVSYYIPHIRIICYDTLFYEKVWFLNRFRFDILTVDDCLNITMPDYMFSTFGSMTTLQFFDNRINILNIKSFANVTQLLRLNLGDSQIRILSPFVDDDITVFPNLEVLNLNHNGLGNLAPRSFIGLSMLIVLYLVNNFIQYIEQHAFDGLVNLQRLGLQLNPFIYLPDFLLSPLKSLRYPNLSVTMLRMMTEKTTDSMLSVRNKDYQVVFPHLLNINSFVNVTLLREIRLDNNIFKTLLNFTTRLFQSSVI